MNLFIAHSRFSNRRGNEIVRLLQAAVCATTAAMAIGPGSSNASPPSALIDAWTKRALAAKTLDFTCKGSLFVAKGSVSPSPMSRFTTPGPPTDSSHPLMIRLVVDGRGRVRLESQEHAWSFERDRHYATSSIGVFDGKQRYTLFPYGNLSYPNLFISDRDVTDIFRDIRAWPLLLVYRPFAKSMRVIGTKRVAWKAGRTMIDGRSCRRVVFHSDEGHQDTVCVDETRDYLPLRLIRTRQGIAEFEIQIKYHRAADRSWIPASWSLSRLRPDGTVLTTFHAEKITGSVNQALSDDVFKVDPPLGTWVHNYVANESYIIRKNDRRPVLQGEFDGTNYEELRDSEPGEIGKSPEFWKYVVIANLVVLAVIVLSFVYFRRKRARRPSSEVE